jgi:hypothetical protein
LGLPLNDPGLVDGFIGFAVGAFGVGTERIAAILHEIRHAMGRIPNNVDSLGNPNPPNPQGPIFVSALDLVRFVSPGNRLFDGNLNAPTPAYFSVDGGAKKVADWAAGNSPSDFLSPPRSNLAPNDAFDDIGFGTTLAKFTTADIQLMEALGFRVGATAVMVLRRSDSLYQVYGIGSNAISANSQPLGPVGTDWRFVTLGGFNDSSTTSDMLLRNSSGAFQVYNISNNQLTGSSPLGAVGPDWQFFGVGNFSGIPGMNFINTPGNTDMMLRDSNTGDFRVYNISNNRITGSFLIGDVGLNWQFSGIGNFSGVPGASDMILRNTDTGGLQVYNISNNQLTGSAFIGTVGLDWQFSGVGKFSSNPGESDMILRNTDTGELLVYNMSNNRITGSFSIGTVGLDWQFAGVAPRDSEPAYVACGSEAVIRRCRLNVRFARKRKGIRALAMSQKWHKRHRPGYSIALANRPGHPRFRRTKLMERRESESLLRLDARELDHLGPFLDIFGDELRELVRRVRWHRHDAKSSEALLDVWIEHRRVGLLVECRDDFRRRALGSAETNPGSRLVALENAIDRRHV